jgi:deazaflavin-dependent oxidoreductase (nitroreductase family)
MLFTLLAVKGEDLLMQTYQPQWWHRMLGKITSTRIGTWLTYLMFYPLDRLTLRLTHGQHTLGNRLWGLPVMVLTTTGAKSGQVHQTPLLVIGDGDQVVLIGSNWGRSHHPGWYYKLRAHPQATLSSRNHTQTYTAREATNTERDKYWPMADVLYPGYSAYRERARRKIPVMILTPVDQSFPDPHQDSVPGKGIR